MFVEPVEFFEEKQSVVRRNWLYQSHIQGQKWEITWGPKLESLFNFWGSYWTFKQNKDPREIRGYSSAGRAPALQAGGHRFDPDYLHQNGLIAQPVRASAW